MMSYINQVGGGRGGGGWKGKMGVEAVGERGERIGGGGRGGGKDMSKD